MCCLAITTKPSKTLVTEGGTHWMHRMHWIASKVGKSREVR